MKTFDQFVIKEANELDSMDVSMEVLENSISAAKMNSRPRNEAQRKLLLSKLDTISIAAKRIVDSAAKMKKDNSKRL